MADLQGQFGELKIRLEIKRADTGKVEEVELIGFLDEDKYKEFLNGSHPLDSSTERSD